MNVFTSPRARKVLGGFAVVTAGAMILAGCAGSTPTTAPTTETPSEKLDLTLKIGTILPQTGGLAFLGPPEEAGVGLAADDVNAYAETTGLKLDDIVWGDSGDAANNAWQTTAPRLIQAGVSAAIGAASSGVSKLFLDDFIAAGIITFSPANTSADFTTWPGKNGLYWRTAPSDVLQGEVLGNLIAEDGHSTVASIYLNDAYGTGLNEFFSEAFTGAGGTVVEQQAYNAGDTTFDAQISAVLAANPDAIALITFDEVYTIAPALIAAGYDAKNLYFVDGNLKQFGADENWPAGVSLEGAKGTTPAGPDTPTAFQGLLVDWWAANGDGTTLSDFAYANESYDAVILLALAALAAKSTASSDIITKLQEVSGGSGNGTKCTTYAACADIILAGGVADYDGYSGPITFNEQGDPTEATVGIFQFGADNMFVRIDL